MKLCCLIQLLRQLLPAEGRLAQRWLEPHLSACPDCRRRREGEHALGAALRAEAGANRTPVPPFLANRIKVAVRAGEAGTRPPFLNWQFATVVGAVGMVAIGITLWPGFLGNDAADAAAVEYTRQQTEALVRHVETWSPDTAWTLASGVDQSLQSELDAILSDARTAALLIVRACVPEESPLRLLPEE